MGHLCFNQLINEPTRITSTTSTTIDHIYVTNKQYVRDVAIFKISLSDHFAVGLCWKNGNLGRCVSEDHLSIRYKKVNNEQIKMKLNNLHLNMISVLQSASVNDKLSQFNYILSSVIHDSSKTLVRRVKQTKQPSWFTSYIRDAIKKRDKLKVQNHHSEYKVQRNKVANLIKFAKSNYYRRILIENKGNCRKLWHEGCCW